MATYKDTDAIISSINGLTEATLKNLGISDTTIEIYLMGLKHAIDYIEIAPAIKMSQVIKCGQCNHWERGVCHNPNHRYLMTEKNHYCGYAEEKPNETYTTHEEDE